MLIHTKILFVLSCFCFYNVMSEYLNLYEGQKCRNKGINGTCTNIFKCPKAKHDISNKEYPPICGYSGKEPIVCCTSCYIYTDSDLRDEVFNPHLGTIRKTNSLARNKFNEYLNTLDYPCKVHRRATMQFELNESKNCYALTGSSSGYYYDEILYPRLPGLVHTVVLGYGAEFESAQWLCGGSIISERYILTSANCTSSPELGPVRYMVSGTLKDTKLPDPWRRYNVKRIIPHPDYRPDSKYHDIALIQTESPITFDVQVVPFSVVTRDKDDSIAIAWKELGQKKGLKATLESVSIVTLAESNNDTCDFLYLPQPLLANGFNSTIQVCCEFGSESLHKCADVDRGASIVTEEDKACSFAILGVTSIGRMCGKNGGSALYTRVSYYVPWIESVVWPGETATRYGTDNIDSSSSFFS